MISTVSPVYEARVLHCRLWSRHDYLHSGRIDYNDFLVRLGLMRPNRSASAASSAGVRVALRELRELHCRRRCLFGLLLLLLAPKSRPVPFHAAVHRVNLECFNHYSPRRFEYLQFKARPRLQPQPQPEVSQIFEVKRSQFKSLIRLLCSLQYTVLYSVQFGV